MGNYACGISAGVYLLNSQSGGGAIPVFGSIQQLASFNFDKAASAVLVMPNFAAVLFKDVDFTGDYIVSNNIAGYAPCLVKGANASVASIRVYFGTETFITSTEVTVPYNITTKVWLSQTLNPLTLPP
jgi:hypothetical protein